MHCPPICGSESMTSARRPRSPSSNTWNKPMGPAPMITASVTVASFERSSDKDILQMDALAGGRLDAACGEPLLGEPLGVEKPRLIFRAAVAKHGDDHVSRAELARDSGGGRDVDAARAAEEQTLLVEEPIHVAHGFRILDVHGVIERRIGEVLRHAPGADALGDRAAAGRFENAVADEFVEAAAGRVGEHAAHRIAPRFEELRNARNRTAGARRGDERIDASVRLLPDLGARRLDVRAAIRGVVELIGPDGVAERCGDALRDLLVLIGIAVGKGGDLVDFGTEHLEEPVLLRRLVVRHHDDAAVTARVADVRETDSRVAGGALDDDTARAQLTAFLGIDDDRERCAVFDRAARIHEFGLAEDLAPGLLAQASEPDEGCVTDRSCKAVLHFRGQATPLRVVVSDSIAPASGAAATSPMMSSAGAETLRARAMAARSARRVRITRCPGSVARSTSAAGRSGGAPASRSLATMRSSCATIM